MRGVTALQKMIGVLAIIASVATGVPPAEAAPTPAFYRDASRLEGALRRAIERQPEGLLKSLATSERVCGLGEGAEARGETESAEADWSTLNQVVELLDEPEVEGVRRALGEARLELADFESTYRRAWQGQRVRVRKLGIAAGQVRQGIEGVTSSLVVLDAAFMAWRDHRCEAALAATATSNLGAGTGVERIAGGMERLWILGEPAPRRD